MSSSSSSDIKGESHLELLVPENRAIAQLLKEKPFVNVRVGTLLRRILSFSIEIHSPIIDSFSLSFP